MGKTWGNKTWTGTQDMDRHISHKTWTGTYCRPVADCREAVGHRDVPDETCEYCGGTVRIIASIEDPAVIEKILTHIERRDTASSHAPRAPPASLSGDSP